MTKVGGRIEAKRTSATKKDIPMRCVAPAFVSRDLHLTETIPLLARDGVEWVEVGVGDPRYFDPDTPMQVARLRTALQQDGVRVNSLHSLFGPDFDVSSEDDAIVAAARQTHARHLAAAGQLGACFYVLHPSAALSTQQQATREPLVDRLSDSCARLVPHAQQAGVIIALENMLPGHLGDNPQELLATLEAVGSPHLGICFDTGHAHICGDMVEAAEALLPQTVTIHAQDNNGHMDQHLFPGHGTIDWCAFVRIYDEVGCTAPVMFEALPPEGCTMGQGIDALEELIARCRSVYARGKCDGG